MDNKNGSAAPPVPTAPPPGALQILITWVSSTGQMSVQGAINDKVIAYGMLDAARDEIHDYIERNKSTIVVPRIP